MNDINNPSPKLLSGNAMDFLMTYGWALLVVILAIGALWAFGVFDTETFKQEEGDELICLNACNPEGWHADLDRMLIGVDNKIQCICVENNEVKT